MVKSEADFLQWPSSTVLYLHPIISYLYHSCRLLWQEFPARMGSDKIVAIIASAALMLCEWHRDSVPLCECARARGRR